MKISLYDIKYKASDICDIIVNITAAIILIVLAISSIIGLIYLIQYLFN